MDKSIQSHIEDVETPKEAWDTFATLFSIKNTSQLQMLERELMNIFQGDMTVSEYFLKVKNLCREIEQLDANVKIGEDGMRRIILNGMRPEYNAYITTIEGRAMQPTLLELKSLLASPEAIAKQLTGLTVKHENEKALYSGRCESRGGISIDDNLRRRRSVMSNAIGVHVQEELLEAKREKKTKMVITEVEEWSAIIANDDGTMRENASSRRMNEASW